MSGHIARSAVRSHLAAGRISRPGTLDPGRPRLARYHLGNRPAGYTGPESAAVAFSYLGLHCI